MGRWIILKHEQKQLKMEIKKVNLAIKTHLDSKPPDMQKVKTLIAHVGQLNWKLSKLINPHDTGPETWQFNPALVEINQKLGIPVKPGFNPGVALGRNRQIRRKMMRLNKL